MVQLVTRTVRMNLILGLLFLTGCLARPKPVPAYSSEELSDEHVEIVYERREHHGDGRYKFDFETENGINWKENGSPKGSAEAMHVAGDYSYPMEDGGTFYLNYIADNTHPSSPYLPVAPEFPHELPQWILDQIEKAKIVDLNRIGSSEGYYN